MKGNHHDRHQRDQSADRLLTAFATAHHNTTTSGGDFFEMAVAALGSLPRHEVVQLRDGAQAMLAAAQQVLGDEA